MAWKEFRDMKVDEIQDLIQKMVEAWNGRDLDFILNLLHENVVWDDPAMQSPAVGRDAVKSFIKSLLVAFPDFGYEIRHPICIASTGNRCAVPWRITVTHLASFNPPGFGPTGQAAVFEGIDLIDFEGHRICKIETQFNPVIAAEQFLSLRIRPRAGSLQEKLMVWIQRTRAWHLRLSRKSDG